jgi:hypothetical protein
MKNFYEATVTKPTLKLDINLVLNPVGGNIPCQITINNEIVFDETFSEVRTILGQVNLMDPVNISIQIERQHPQALEVSLLIDNYEIIPKYLHCAVPPTHYIDFNEEWTISIPNFYQWHHIITGQGWIE